MSTRILDGLPLKDVVARIDDLTDEDVICAKWISDWTLESFAYVTRIPEFTDLRTLGPIPDYFLEVFIAREILENWSVLRGGRKPTLDEKCEALIYFAKNDADIPLQVRP
ncbi:MAG TPA: hypothetical protein VGQ99_15320 [Tepidisphaeraceae bacterium]|jgi:hypothetical protein|nr:hypothetical protein [Tepidisphaeraceae bacterium]